MPDISSVESAVEKMVTEAPAKETPSAKAPSADTTPSSTRLDADASSEPTKDAAEMSAFEQELIEEFREEYDQVPPEHQPAFLNSLKRSYRKQAKQMTELGTLRKAIKALSENGVTNEDLVALIQQKRGNGRAAPSETKPTETERGFKRWLAKSTDPGEKENLREAEQVVREMVEDILTSRLEDIRDKEVKPLKDRLDWHDRQTLTKRSQTLEQDINELEDTLGYPGSLIESHREAMKSLGLREPELSAEDLLVRTAGFATVKAAMLKVAAKQGANGKPERSSTPASVVKQPGQTEMPKTSRGVVSITKALDLLVRAKP